MKYFYLSLIGFFMVQGNSYGFSLNKSKKMRGFGASLSIISGTKLDDKNVSDARYKEFENDLEGEFGEGLSIEEEVKPASKCRIYCNYRK